MKLALIAIFLIVILIMLMLGLNDEQFDSSSTSPSLSNPSTSPSLSNPSTPPSTPPSTSSIIPCDTSGYKKHGSPCGCDKMCLSGYCNNNGICEVPHNYQLVNLASLSPQGE